MIKYLFLLIFLLVLSLIAYYQFVYIPSNRPNFNNLLKIVATPSPYPEDKLDPYKIYSLVNDYRASKGLQMLRWNPDICTVAKERLDETYSDWSHNEFKSKRYKEVCSNCIAGENLAKGQTSNQEIVDSWINSPSHLENIIKPVYKSTCITTGMDKNITYTVQLFSSNY